MHGGTVDVYIKTQSCESLSDCRKIASLKITLVSHNNDTFTMKCDDRFIDEFHKELPSVDTTLYADDKTTFAGDNERKLPILYGHLENAPAVVYIEPNEDTSAFDGDNILIVPDKSGIESSPSSPIYGIKRISSYSGEWADSTEQQTSEQLLINHDVLKIKLGDYTANVFSQPPDKLNMRLREGDAHNNYEFNSDWASQFEVDGGVIRLLTGTSQSNSQQIRNGHLLCQEVSKLVGVKTRKHIVFRWDERDYSMFLPHVVQLSDDLFSSSNFPDFFDMLSVKSFRIDDTTAGAMGGAVSGEGYVYISFNEFDSQWLDLTGWDGGGWYNWDQLSFELEFEAPKVSASVSEGANGKTHTDGHLYGAFKTSSYAQTMDNEYFPRFEIALHPQVAKGYDEHTETIVNQELFDLYGTTQPVGFVDNISKGGETDIDPSDGEYYDVFDHWYSPNDPLNFGSFTNLFHRKCPIRIYTARAENGTEISDNRHPFHVLKQTEKQTKISNTWRNSYKLLRQEDYRATTKWTGYIAPSVSNQTDVTVSKYGLKSEVSGMLYSRVWYQEQVFNERFFVNAKGRYKNHNSITAPDGYRRKMSVKNAMLWIKNAEDEPLNSDEFIREDDDKILLQTIDMLKDNKFKYCYASGYRYELVLTFKITCPYADIPETDHEVMFYDIELNDFRGFTTGGVPASMTYKFLVDANIWRFGDELEQWELLNAWWDVVLDGVSHAESLQQGSDFQIYPTQFRYARRIHSNGILSGWEFLDEEDPSITPFPIETGFNYSTNEPSVEWDNKIVVAGPGSSVPHNTINLTVYLFNGTKPYQDEIPCALNAYYTHKELIRNPSHVIENLVTKELGAATILRRNIEDQSYFLDFSLGGDDEGIKVMEKICQSSSILYKTNLADGNPTVIGIKHSYFDADVDKHIKISEIMKYKFSKTKIEDVVLKCRIKYGFDYVTEEYTKTSEWIEHEGVDANQVEIKDRYIELYDMNDEETYTLEFEAPYIQEKMTAEILSKHIFEMSKNQHIIIDFDVPLQEGIELEVGDIIDFVNYNNLRANLGSYIENQVGTKPFGFDISNLNVIIDQHTYPYFMIKKIKKRFEKS